MRRCELASTVLQLKAMGIDNIMKFDWLAAPPAETMIRALELLHALGALGEDARFVLMLCNTRACFAVPSIVMLRCAALCAVLCCAALRCFMLCHAVVRCAMLCCDEGCKTRSQNFFNLTSRQVQPT